MIKKVHGKGSHIISFQAYPFEVIVSFHKEYSELEPVLKKLLPKTMWADITNLKDNQYGITYMFSTGASCIWFKEPMSVGEICHEVFHAVSMLMERIGVKLVGESDENYAYLIQYLVNEILKKTTLK